MVSVIISLIRRDITLMYRQGTIIFPFILAIISAFLFQILVNKSSTNCFYALVMINMFLSSMIYTKNIIQQDDHDATLQHLYIANISPYILVCSKCLTHFIIAIIPIIISIPIMGIMFNIDLDQQIPLILIITLISSVISPVCILIASLTLSISNSTSIIALLIFPLVIPTFIIAGELLHSILSGDLNTSMLYILIGMILIITPVSVFFCNINIRNCVS